MTDPTTLKLYDAVFGHYARLAGILLSDNWTTLQSVEHEKKLFKPTRKNLITWNPKQGSATYIQPKMLQDWLQSLQKRNPDLHDDRVEITIDGFTCAFQLHGVFEYKARLDELVSASERRYLATEEL